MIPKNKKSGIYYTDFFILILLVLLTALKRHFSCKKVAQKQKKFDIDTPSVFPSHKHGYIRANQRKIAKSLLQSRKDSDAK